VQISPPNPKRSLLVLLGASSFTKAPSLAEGPAFFNSMYRVRTYLASQNGLGIDRANILQLFDDNRPPGSQLEDIAAFLSARQVAGSALDSPENLFVYYVGHGLFTSDRRYCLAVRFTDERNVGFSTIRGRDLADVVSENAIQLRRFLILDCCFAASMYGDFLSGPGEAATTQLLEDLPERGTSLLCASSPRDVALAPKNLECTMFSDALLKALNAGNSTFGPRMSLAEVGAVVKNILKRDYPSDWVRPEIHSPDMRRGDISSIPLFPNPSWSPVDQESSNAAAQRKAEEAAAQREADERAAAQRKAEEAAQRESDERAAVQRKAEEAAAAQHETEKVATAQSSAT
jgi:Caspase domain